MSLLVVKLKNCVLDVLTASYPEHSFSIDQITVNETKAEFEGEYTVVLFPFVKLLKCKPDEIGTLLGTQLQSQFSDFVTRYQLVSGFLNISIQDRFLINYLQNSFLQAPTLPSSTKRVMIEYSSPNTNKPLHFGHLRNNFLGAALANILKTQGHEVVKANLINDRGIHICKSMIAWMRYANNATPASTGIKGDHLVGDYYVKFNDVYKEEVAQLIASGMDAAQAEKQAPILLAAQALLLKWEQGDADTRALWQEMNGWVYEGFKDTYERLGISFDQYYYESNTYLLGKAIIEDGLQKGVLFKKENNSVWIDLTNDGLDQKLLLRGDGTAVYITQDIGTAKLKYDEHQLNQSIYVIADEQNYHMQVLKLILSKLGEPCADGIFHLSYGMVELPSGRMKSREGTVVDADDMIEEMITLAQKQTEEAGKTSGFTAAELSTLYKQIGLGALKFYLLRVDPKKKMIFDPKESIDLHGYTATFIQYAHARICSILRKEGIAYDAPQLNKEAVLSLDQLAKAEKQVVLLLEQFDGLITAAANEYNPSLVANYCFQLAQAFNTFYDAHSIAHADTEAQKQFRLYLIIQTAYTLKRGMLLLGIEVPTRM
jgi:arginyl-tRNA synthetase